MAAPFSTSILDDFNRVDDPLGPPWLYPWNADFDSTPSTIGTEAISDGDGISQLTSSHWTSDSFSTLSHVVEVYSAATFSGSRKGYLCALVSNPGDASFAGGYVLEVWVGGSTIYRIDGVTLTEIDAGSGNGPSDGDEFGLVITGNSINAYANGTDVADAIDSSFDTGFIGFGMDIAVNFDYFGGGESALAPTIPALASRQPKPNFVYAYRRP